MAEDENKLIYHPDWSCNENAETCSTDSESGLKPETTLPAGALENALLIEATSKALSKEKKTEDENGDETDAAPEASHTEELVKAKKYISHVIPAPKPLSNEAVTDHTASLWKYNPIPSDEPDPAPEYLSCDLKFPGGRVMAARVRGKKHKHDGTNCDDWYEVGNCDKITVVAVSDGAGSKKFSRVGARISCKTAVGYMTAMFKSALLENPGLMSDMALELSDHRCISACGKMAGIVQQAVIKAYDAVETAFYSRVADVSYEKILGRGLQFKDFSGTLLLAVTVPVSETECLVITCQIGDGMIALFNSHGKFDESLKLMGVPDSGDFSGETDFLTSPQMRKLESLQNRTKITRGVFDTMLVMTDGVADDYFPNETEMYRLYYDLIINGIIWNGDDKGPDMSRLTAQQLKLFKTIPGPLSYPWVNDQSIKVSIHYVKRICEAVGLTLEDIWNEPNILELAMLETEKTDGATDEKLKIWLDNYVERGSFDDRTLVIVRM